MSAITRTYCMMQELLTGKTRVVGAGQSFAQEHPVGMEPRQPEIIWRKPVRANSQALCYKKGNYSGRFDLNAA